MGTCPMERGHRGRKSPDKGTNEHRIPGVGPIRGHHSTPLLLFPAVPAFVTLPPTLRLAAAIGFVETVALLTYGLSIAAFEQDGSTAGVTGSDLAPIVLIGLYAVFAAIVFAVTFGLLQRRMRSFTPFLLVQAFGVVVAQPLVTGAGTRALGVVVAALAVAAAGSLLAPASREALR